MKNFVYIICLFLASNTYAIIATPSLYRPSSNFTLKRFDTTLSIYSVAKATGYQIQYDTTNSYTSKYLQSNWATNATIPYIKTGALRKGRKYYWRARAFSSGDTSNWSNSYEFTVYNKYELVDPLNGVNGPIKSLYGGYAGENTNIKYIFELDTAGGAFRSTNHLIRTQESNYFIDSNYFKFGKAIIWRARAVNEWNDTLDWSDSRSYFFYTKPTLNSPGFVVHPSFLLSWPSMGAAEVILEFDTALTFNSGILKRVIYPPGTLSDSLKNLYFGKRIYCRVQAKFNDQYSYWSNITGSTVLSASFGVKPENNSIQQTLKPSFYWSTLIGCVSHAQFAKDSLFQDLLEDTLLISNSFLYDDTLKYNTNYFWRLRFMHENDTSVWASFSFKTYTGLVTLSTPFLNDVNQNVLVNFKFYVQPWPDNYVIEIDTGLTLSAIPSRYHIVASNFYEKQGYKQIDTVVPYGSNIAWRVYGIRGNDTAGRTQIYTFSTKKMPIPKYPSNNYIGVGTQTNVELYTINGTDSAIWEIDTAISFNSPILHSGISKYFEDVFFKGAISIKLPGELRFETKYFWRVKYLTAIDTSQWSTPFSFTTTLKPKLTSPLNNATKLSKNPKLIWSIGDSDDDYTYQYQISDSNDFTSIPIKSLAKSSPAEVIENCEYLTTYYWRARAAHSKDTSSWSDTWLFNTSSPPAIAKVVLNQPFNATKNITIPDVLLIWNSTAYATSYDLQVGLDANMTNLVVNTNRKGDHVNFNGMKANEKYYWRVRGISTELIGPWSDIWSFETVKTSSIYNNELFDKLFVGPNPSAFTLEVKSNEMCSVSIMNVQGLTVVPLTKTALTHIIDVSILSNGIYWININNNKGTVVRKVVVQH